jgi:hypothetical protein
MVSFFMCQEITTSCSLLTGHCLRAHFAVACLKAMKMCTECHQYDGVHSGESLCYVTANFKVIQHNFQSAHRWEPPWFKINLPLFYSI